MPPSLILGIESSCDETSAALVRNGHGASGRETQVLSNVVASQLIHADYGGVVPELASREHLRNIVPVVREAMQQASAAAGKALAYADLDAIAVTVGPGLAGALLVGITFAKSLAFAANKPLIAVNHLEGHIHAVLMHSNNMGGPSIAPSSDGWGTKTLSGTSPLLALVVSGGHTHLYLATRTPQNTWHYRNVGKTLDDAAGEAYDKAAKLLGLPYPGGPWMDRLGALAAPGTFDPNLFPFTQIKKKATGNTAPKLQREIAAQKQQDALKGTGFSPYISNSDEHGALAPEGSDPTRFDMSFSGIKTAVRRYVELHHMQPSITLRDTALREAGLHKAKPTAANISRALEHLDQRTLNLIASFQVGVVKNLASQTFKAAEHFAAKGILVSGGVSANSHLRNIFRNMAADAKLPIAFPTVALSTDNAAMIAAAAYPKLLAGDFAPTTLEPTPQLRLG